MKMNLKSVALAKDPAVEATLEMIDARDMDSLMYALEKLANWVMDSDIGHPQMTKQEFADEIEAMILFRAECARAQAEEDRANEGHKERA